MYDLVIVGGSIAGLTTAREVSKHGFKVIVLEEDLEIGTPEHCGGVVSLKALLELGVIPDKMLLENIRMARIYSPSRKSIEIDAKNIVAIDRRKLDKEIAKQAIMNNTEIALNTTMLDYEVRDDLVKIKTDKNIIESRMLVDARGCKVIMQDDRSGAIISAQHEISAEWLNNAIEVYLDNLKYPGFFAWFIPNGTYLARAGVAGRNINAANTLNEFLNDKGKHSFMKYVYAPIWVKGPLKRFVYDKVIRVGDAAGQTKPTTAGGIYSCGMAGIFAGNAIADALENNDLSLLHRYEQSWFGKFGKEFEKMLLARRVFERLDNKAIDDMFDAIDDDLIKDIEDTDFDFHSNALIKMLGISKSLSIAKSILGSEIRRLFS
ncbi:MAG: digeranylgeranylglycerophospholipid reductase [Candidatus Nitrosocaldaceae archaeon]|nr:MAG: digeranylgeranylglycerophospholipid reductase [Candidatus Nitrosocaldaceae archaeon]